MQILEAVAGTEEHLHALRREKFAEADAIDATAEADIEQRKGRSEFLEDRLRLREIARDFDGREAQIVQR